jgi:membrane fusion protein (multidrug efflux system)
MTTHSPTAPIGSGVEVADSTTRTKRRSGIRGALLIVAVVGLGAGAYYWNARQFETTDNAQIDGDISDISARAAGTITAVYVTENQFVEAGDKVAELDPRDLKAALDVARAAVSVARADLAVESPTVDMTEVSNAAALSSAESARVAALAGEAAAERQVARISAELARAEAQSREAHLQLERARELLRGQALARAAFDTLESNAIAAEANVAAVREELGEARERVIQQHAEAEAAHARRAEIARNGPNRLATRRASVLSKQASLEAALAALAQAELNLSHATIVTPVRGIIARKTVAVGNRVEPGQSLVAIVQTEDLWVTANLRETQLANIVPGQAASVHVDALDRDFRGVVESIGGTTGARLSIFPPENAAGNYVKVVQRIPVKIRLDADQEGLDKLRPGMSVEPRIRL